MSFTKLNEGKLRQVADDFAVEIDREATKAEIIAALVEDGITFEMVEAQDKTDEVAKAKAEAALEAKKKRDDSPQVLLKMERENPTYETWGARFTRDHPFVLVDTATAEVIVENEEGIRYATPKEAQAYYG